MNKTKNAWFALVLKSMSVEELRKESVNPENSVEERRAMQAELRRRS